MGKMQKNNSEHESIRFSYYRESIIDALNKNGDKLGIDERVRLVDGFIRTPIVEDLGTVGGPFIPTIALVGDSGRLYFFALKAILPDMEGL